MCFCLTTRLATVRWQPYVMPARTSIHSTFQAASYIPLASLATCASVPACGPTSARSTTDVLLKTTEIKVKTATKRMFNRYNSLLERNRLAECGVVDVEIRPSYMKIRQHEHEINELRRQLRKTERRVYTEQRTILKPRLNLSKAILRKMRSPKSRFCRSYDFTKEQDIEEYIGWFRTIGLPIQNYIIKELEEQYGQELTLFREKVDEFNMTLTQPDAKKIN